MRDLYVETIRGLRAEYDDKLVKDSFDYDEYKNREIENVAEFLFGK